MDRRTLVNLAVATCCVAGWLPAAHAETYFAGLNVRTDRATQATRLGGGVQLGRLSVNLVVDPVGYGATGEQSDTDVFAEVTLWRGWGVLGGWRVAAAPVVGMTYWQHRPFVGVSAPLPTIAWGHVRMRIAGEVAMTVVAYGDELPTRMVELTPGWSLIFRAELGRGF
jgi:hypothetical protein